MTPLGPQGTGDKSSRSWSAAPRVVRDEAERDQERNPCRKCYQGMGQCPQFFLKFFVLALVLFGWICGGGFVLRALEKDEWDTAAASKALKLVSLGLSPTQTAALADLGCLDELTDDNPWKLESAWLFCLTTITTIGWGTQAPVTWGGRLFTIFYATFGILLALLCYAQCGVLLVQVVHLMHRCICAHKYHVDGHGELKPKGVEEVARLFEKSDKDGTGTLDGMELQNMLSRLGGHWVDSDELDDIMEAADVDGSGFVGQEEFKIAASVYFAKRESERAVVPVIVSTVIFLMMIFFGGWFWMWREEAQNWTYWEGCWFMFTTLVTLGYGDFKPTHANKVNVRWAWVWIFFGMGFMSMLVVSYAKLLAPRINRLKRAFHRTTNDAADWGSLGKRQRAQARMAQKKKEDQEIRDEIWRKKHGINH